MAARRERRRKTFYPRVNPMTRYDSQKFIERYRVSKEIVTEISENFVVSGYCSTGLSPRGGGLSVEERVSLLYMLYS